MSTEQSYQNHVRWYPLFHFVTTPLLIVILIALGVRLFQEPGFDRALLLTLSVAVVLIHFAARLQALKAQDRIIRLEERLRYSRILPAELQDRAASLAAGKMISLRFASDDELPELVSQVIEGKLNKAKEIKLAIKDWRADNLRV